MKLAPVVLLLACPVLLALRLALLQPVVQRTSNFQ
jgi:hypothetical protein